MCSTHLFSWINFSFLIQTPIYWALVAQKCILTHCTVTLAVYIICIHCQYSFVKINALPNLVVWGQGFPILQNTYFQ